MLLHHQPLVWGETIGVAKDWSILLVNLADIVQQSCLANPFDGLPRQSKRPSDRDRIVMNAPRMTRRVWISCLNGLHHELQQLLVRSLQCDVSLLDLPQTKD